MTHGFNLITSLRTRISKCSHMLRSWGQDFNVQILGDTAQPVAPIHRKRGQECRRTESVFRALVRPAEVGKQETEEGRGHGQVGSEACQQRQEGSHFLPQRRVAFRGTSLADHLWGAAWEAPLGSRGLCICSAASPGA